MFITAFTSARHMSLSWLRLSQFRPAHPIPWRSILILSSHLSLGLQTGIFPSGLLTGLDTLIFTIPRVAVTKLQKPSNEIRDQANTWNSHYAIRECEKVQLFLSSIRHDGVKAYWDVQVSATYFPVISTEYWLRMFENRVLRKTVG